MKARIIRNEEMYKKALAFVESLMDALPGSQEEEELELWSLLIAEYEKKQYPIEDPDPIEAIRFRMEQLGLRRKDLESFIGQKSKVSEVMNRKRPLSLQMIRALHTHLNIPAEVLVRESLLGGAKKTLASERSIKRGALKPRATPKPAGKMQAATV